MRRLLRVAFVVVLASSSAWSCVVRERVVARPGPVGCRGGTWVEPYYGRHGRYHPGHWRCPGVVERVEID